MILDHPLVDRGRVPRHVAGNLGRVGAPWPSDPEPYLADPLAVWDTWTKIASRPVAFEVPSAGFLLDWRLIDSLRARGATFATLTHAAGISSTGDPNLDAMLPLDEPVTRFPREPRTRSKSHAVRGDASLPSVPLLSGALKDAAAHDGRVRFRQCRRHTSRRTAHPFTGRRRTGHRATRA